MEPAPSSTNTFTRKRFPATLRGKGGSFAMTKRASDDPMPTTMKAVVKTGRGAGREFTQVREVPIPKPKNGEALVKVLATAVCGTDKHIYGWHSSIQGRVSPPRIYGHEFCGIIEELGPRPGRTDVKP